MGATFSALHVRSEDLKVVQGVMRRVARGVARIAPAKNGWTTVCEEVSQVDREELERMAKRLSERLACTVLGLGEIARCLGIDPRRAALGFEEVESGVAAELSSDATRWRRVTGRGLNGARIETAIPRCRCPRRRGRGSS